MRLKITLQHAENVLLSWDYQYAVQSWIYNTLSQADEELTTKLHDIGYPYDKKRFKLFGFGQWVSLPYLKKGESGMLLQSGYSEIQVSFLLPEILSTFISGLFKDSKYTFYFPNKKYVTTEVTGVEILPIPDFSQEPVSYKLITGARISATNLEKKHADYIGPDHSDYVDRWIQNLYHKYLSSITENSPGITIDEIHCEIVSEGKSKMINLTKNGDKINSRVFTYEFKLHAPVDIHRTLYYAGAGEECSLGMGWVEMKGREMKFEK